MAGHDGVDVEESLFSGSREALLAALEASDAGVFVLGSDFTVEWVNEAIEDYFGLSRSSVVGEDKCDLVEGRLGDAVERSDRFADTIHGAYESDTHVEEFTCHVVPGDDRDERWLRYESYPLDTGSEGRIERYTDVTEQRLEITRKARAIENAPVGITMTDPTQPDNPLVYANETFLDLTGYSREEVLGWNHRRLQGPDTSEEPVAELRRAIEAKEPTTVTLRNYRKDGTMFWNRVSIVPIREDGEVVNWVGFQEALTDLKESQRELRRRNDLFAKAQEVADVGAWEYDVESGDARWTEQVYEIHGVSTDFDPLPENSIQYYHPDDRDTIRELFTRAVEAAEPYEVELRFITDDGEKRWVRTTGIPQTEDGEVVRVRGAIQDITDQKEYERELERQNDRLEEFASVVSHDLQNPLQVAISNLDLARRECDSDRLDAIERAHDRMGDLIDDLLALARQGQSVAEPEPVDLEATLRQCWHNIDTGDATLDVDVTADVWADSSRLQQLFSNLLANAVEHGGDGVSVEVGRLPDGFSIADTGPGIPEAEREEVFESGYTTAEDGNGLGLAIANRIAQAHGWEIGVTESDTGGARFEITGVEFV